MNIVWLKRDLRARDNAALKAAIQSGPTVALYVVEPEWMASSEFSFNHLRFVGETLNELRKDLHDLGIPLVLRHGSIPEVFQHLHDHHPIQSIYSHEETGLLWSFDRDKRVIEWCRMRSIPWHEFRQFGVVRRLKNRDHWLNERNRIVDRKTIPTLAQSWTSSPWNSNVPSLLDLIPKDATLFARPQGGGRTQADAVVDSFFDSRGLQYFGSISSPITAHEGCSRISPYLAYGVLSLTEVAERIRKKKSQLSQIEPPMRRRWEGSLKAFESRLFWHCHFIQKLESEPEIEFQNFNREFDGMRESDWNEGYFQAWCRGETGFPMIDACMKALLETGWINFRMRAMLMSFAAYQLWLHWKKPAEFLARQFLDFEPGIHYSQVQMQSGVTGINTVRIYSPIKQQRDQDPDGIFVRRYLPALRSVSDADLVAPHQMPPFVQALSGFQIGRDYPEPIVDEDASYRLAKDRIFEWKKRPQLKRRAQGVFQKHGSRKKSASKLSAEKAQRSNP